MKQKIKSVLLQIPFGARLLDEYSTYHQRRLNKQFSENLKNKSSNEIFTDYYEKTPGEMTKAFQATARLCNILKISEKKFPI